MPFQLRYMTDADVALLRTLANVCPPLGLHSAFTYWVVSHFYGDYSLIAFDEAGEAAGYIMSITKRDEPDLLYVWQIGVLSKYRRKALARELIEKLYNEKIAASKIKRLQVTIDSNNVASNRFFRAFAERHGAAMKPIGEAAIVDPIEGKSETETLFEIQLPDL
ncbi:MAG TPA: GNAT family N-acetyltransferase [Planktothrix sp.]|jgi:L-2,4-diaminobutyric acid acetyltransferase